MKPVTLLRGRGVGEMVLCLRGGGGGGGVFFNWFFFLNPPPPPPHHLHCSDVEGSTRTRVDLEAREKRVLDKVPHIPLMMQIDKILNPLTFQNIL